MQAWVPWLRARAVWILGGVGVLGTLALVYLLPLILVPEAGLDPERRLKAENDLRTTLVQTVGGAVVLVGTARTLHINREGQITERFTRAIDQLGQTGEEKLDVRLGGIYALERIARDSKSDRGPIVEVLTAFLREHARWNADRAGTPSATDHAATGSRSERLPRLRTDFQAVATILGRNRWSRRYGVDLHNVDLRAANLNETHLEGASLSGAHLERAGLRGAHLEGAGLFGAHLERARLRDAHLERAILVEAQLKKADLHGSHLEAAYVVGAYLQGADLRDAHLEGANLRGANLEGSRLNGAYLQGADLRDAHLEGADLHGAYLQGVEGLTPAQVERVIGLSEAIGVPPGLLGT